MLKRFAGTTGPIKLFIIDFSCVSDGLLDLVFPVVQWIVDDILPGEIGLFFNVCAGLFLYLFRPVEYITIIK